MYSKNLTEQIKLRLSKSDFDFLVFEADACGLSVSQYLRNLIRSARSACFIEEFDSEVVHYGDSETDKLDIV